MLFSIDLVGPLMTDHVTEMDETVTKLQLKYKTYIVEYDTEYSLALRSFNEDIDTRYGLCNGIRLVITRMRRYVIEGRVISGCNVGDQVFVSRLSISPSDVMIPFNQGQSLKHVGLYLPTVTSREGLKILITDEDGEDTNVTSNVVYEEIFCNV
ncbi:hypothetical protein MTR_1g086460 [Medicago truncatula]|uniref:Uncharacterized protein n=1 Tax=Medicago truncatula TaxID=3880 RepID=G7ICT1_MEDTR|nr:hypothetical protein MTR_1g086460 [Medicago truncatula]